MSLLLYEAADVAPSAARAGKVKGVALPQEYELAKFVRDVKNPHPSWDTHTAACEWDGVECDKSKSIVDLRWRQRELNGTLHWLYLPRTIQQARLLMNRLGGDVDFTTLPQPLTCMWLQHNFFTGEPDFAHLPPNIDVLNVSSCRFTGFVDLSCLQHTTLMKPTAAFDITGNPGLRGKIARSHMPTQACWKIPASWIEYAPLQ